MSENSTPFEGENLASYEALKTAISLADGFTLIFAVTNTEAGAQEVMRRLWRDGVRYQRAWLRDPNLPLIDQVLESVQSTKQPVMVLGLEGLTTLREEMGRSLQNLNWTRPQWATRLPQAVIFWVTSELEAALARDAPDLWRFRSLRAEFHFVLVPRQARIADVRKRLRTLDLAPRVRLATMMELFRLKRDQRTLQDAAEFVIRVPGLPWQAEFEYLQKFGLMSANINDRSLEQIGPLPRLQVLELVNARVSDKGVASMFKRIRPVALTDAQFLALRIGKATIGELAELPKLADLTIIQTSITRDALAGITNILPLKHLYIASPSIRDGDFEIICNLRQLSSLGIYAASVSDEGVKRIENLGQLRTLALSVAKITSECLPSISQLKSLRTLDLSGTQVSDSYLDILAGLPEIKKIDLRYSGVSSNGVRSLQMLFAFQRRRVEVLSIQD